MVHWRAPSALAFRTSLLAQQDPIRETQPVELALWPTSPTGGGGLEGPRALGAHEGSELPTRMLEAIKKMRRRCRTDVHCGTARVSWQRMLPPAPRSSTTSARTVLRWTKINIRG